MPQGQKLNGHPGRESVRETSAHDTGQRGYRQSSLEIEFLDNRLLLLKRHFALFVDPCNSSGRNPQQTNENTSKNYSARGGSKNLGKENAAEDGASKFQKQHKDPTRQPFPTRVPSSASSGQTSVRRHP